MTVKQVAFAAKSRTVRRSADRLYRELLANERLSPDAIDDLERRRGTDIARFAMTSSPFYRDLYAAHGVEPGDLDDPDSWSRLPIIERSQVKESTEAFWTPERAPGTVRMSETGGSTGQPVKLGQDARVPLLALSWRMYRWWGVDPSDNRASIGRWPRGRKEALKSAVQWWPTRHAFLDAGVLSRETMTAFVQECRSIRPRLIEGYLGGLREVAEFAATLPDGLPVPVAVGTTAAPLTEPVRLRLQEVLGAPVFDQYRSAEVQWMAGECSAHSGLHVFSDFRHFDVVDEQGAPVGPGVVGDLVVTDFANRVFPLVRYRMGDRGSLRARRCACGLPFPVMDPPDGRTSDLLRLPDGTVLAGDLMTLFSAEPEAVRLFQIHQQADYEIRLRVVLGDQPDARAAVDRAADVLRVRVHSQVPVTVEEVDTLPYTRGKIRYVLSDVVPPA